MAKTPPSKAGKLLDPSWFVPRMRIYDKHGKERELRDAGLTQAQLQMIEAFKHNKRILVLKSRQMHITTISVLLMLHRMLFNPHRYNVLTVTHEASAMLSCNAMYRHAALSLPGGLDVGALNPDNTKAIGLSYNASIARQLMAGGRSQARSFTYNAIHATEMGLWPTGSSARAGMAIDEEVWASIQNTLHEQEDTRVIIESTATGPSGIYYKMCRVAQTSPEWCFLFFPWFEQASYRRAVPLDFAPRSDEEILMEKYGLDLQQIAWRRHKIEDENLGIINFKREFPSHPDEPFFVSTGTWFDGEVVSAALAALPASAFNQAIEGEIIYEDYDPERIYFMGGDPSGGTGGDEACAVVIKDDGTVVALAASRRWPPHKFAAVTAKLSGQYGGATVLPEMSNSFARAYIERLKHLGVRLWKDHMGKDWVSDRKKKTEAYDYAKLIFDNGIAQVPCPYLLRQLGAIKEQPDGNIEADERNRDDPDPSYGDDRADAFVLAVMCARKALTGRRKQSTSKALGRQRRDRKAQLGVGNRS